MKKYITPEENQKNKEPASLRESIIVVKSLQAYSNTGGGGPRQTTAFLYIFQEIGISVLNKEKK